MAVAGGMALADQTGQAPAIALFTLLMRGRGIQLGSLAAASHYRLDNLVVIVDRNRLQSAGIPKRWPRWEPPRGSMAFGYAVLVDGNDPAALMDIFNLRLSRQAS